MAVQFQLRAGTTAELASFVGASGELVYDEELKRVSVHDGVTQGGKVLVTAEEMGLPLGFSTHWRGTRATIPSGYLSADGTLHKRTTYPALWAWIQKHYAPISDSEWVANPKQRGNYSTGDGSTTFRLPDDNGVQDGSIKAPVLRGDGNGVVAGEAKKTGQMDTDAIRNLTGQFGGLCYPNTYKTPDGVFAYGTDYGSKAPNADAGYQNMTFDASRLVPVAPENRMNSLYGVWIIRVGTVATPKPDAVPFAVLTGSNQFDGTQNVTGDFNVSGKIKGNIHSLLNASGTAPILALRAKLKVSTISGVPTLVASENIASLTVISTGVFEVKFITELPTKDYCVLFGGGEVSTGAGAAMYSVYDEKTTGFKFRVWNYGASPLNPYHVSVGVC